MPFFGSMAGFLGSSVVNNTCLNLHATGNIPPVAGLPGGGLQIPMLTSPSIDTIGVPSECLLLKNMFDPENEVVKLLSYTLRLFCHTFVVLNDIIDIVCCRRSRTLIWMLKKMLKQNALSLGT